jgi:hypothetical protein
MKDISGKMPLILIFYLFTTKKEIIMRYIILVFCLILYLTPHAQVKIGPSIGLNQSYVSAAKNGIFFRVVNEFKPNLSLGIKVEWTINEKNFLVSSIAYNRKEMEAYDRGFIPLTSINFNSINSSLIFNHKIYSGIIHSSPK